VQGEHPLGFAIGLVDKAAVSATPARVARVPDEIRNASEHCPVDQELAKLTKRLPLQTAPLRATRPVPVIDRQPASRFQRVLGTFTPLEQRPMPHPAAAVNAGSATWMVFDEA
jgi:hypothetical protein